MIYQGVNIPDLFVNWSITDGQKRIAYIKYDILCKLKKYYESNKREVLEDKIFLWSEEICLSYQHTKMYCLKVRNEFFVKEGITYKIKKAATYIK